MEGFTKFFNIADTLDIMIYVNNQESYTLTSFVYEVVNDERLIISNPIHEGHLYAMERRYGYYFRFYIENQGMYLFKGTMIERLLYDNLPSVSIKLDSEIKRIQRRKFYRVNFKSKGHFLIEKKIPEHEIAKKKALLNTRFKSEKDVIIEEASIEKFPFESLDLSGGGIRVLTRKVFESGELIKGEVLLNNMWNKFSGEVTRVQKKDDNHYEVGIRFIDLDSATQSRIVSYVFEIERNLIKKGLM
ncbi:MAG: PilZ domain-containing protein [Clostridiales bacterium]|nr:PilZ domain-containing protein [Clostridiales bacterium]